MATIQFEGQIASRIASKSYGSSRENFEFDFLVSQTYPSLVFATTIGDLRNNTLLLELEYNYVTGKLSLLKNTTVGPSCKFLQSRTIQGYLWVLCASISDNHLILQQLIPSTYSPCCILELHNYKVTYTTAKVGIVYMTVLNFPTWWINYNGTRLMFVDGFNFAMYDISMCRCNHNDTQHLSPIHIYNYTTNKEYGDVSLYTLDGKTNGVLVGGSAQGNFQIFTDCPSGYSPTELNFCSRCIPGQSGFLCHPCPSGYMCNGFGLMATNELCQAGYYCPAGTSSSFQIPLACDAGTYCPPGVASGVVNESIVNSARLCAAGYYCPIYSTVPTQHQCPTNSTSKFGAKSVDDCTCNQGHYGFSGSCIKCPEECTCNDSTISLCWVPKFGITDLQNQTIKPLLCPSYSITGGNQCNPGNLPWVGEGEFPCEEGYYGRLCSRCQTKPELYFADGRRCHKCQPILQWLLPVIYASVAIFLGVFAWFDTPSSSAALKITLFHFQTLFALVTSGLQWHSMVLDFVSASNPTSLSYMAIECLIHEWELSYTLTLELLTPALAILLGMLAWLTSVAVSCLLNVTPLDRSARNRRFMKVVVFVITLRYFNMATAIFSIFGCTTDPNDGIDYLSLYPWVSCYNSEYYRVYFIWAVIGCSLEVVGFPILLFWTLVANRTKLRESNMVDVLGSLYAIYVPKRYLWESIVITRRLLIAMILTLLPFNSSWIFLGFFVVIQWYLIIQIIFEPYTQIVDHILDTISQLILLISLFVGMMVGVSILQPFQHSLSIILLVLNLAFLIFGGLLIARHYVSSMWQCWTEHRRKKQYEQLK